MFALLSTRCQMLRGIAELEQDASPAPVLVGSRKGFTDTVESNSGGHAMVRTVFEDPNAGGPVTVQPWIFQQGGWKNDRC